MKKQFFAAVGAILTLASGATLMSQNVMAAVDANHEDLSVAPVLVTRVSKWSDSVSMVLRKQPVTELLPTHVMVMYVSQDHSTVSNSEKSLEAKDLSGIYHNFNILVDMDVKDISGFEEGIEINFSDSNGTMVAGHDRISQISTNNIYYFVQFGNDNNYEYGRAYYGMCSTSDGYIRVSGTECRLSPEQLYGMNSYKAAKQSDEYTDLNEFNIYATKEQKLAAEEAKRKAIEEAARLELEKLEAEKAVVEEELAHLEAEKDVIKGDLAQLEKEKATIEEELVQLEAERLEAADKAADEEASARLELERLEAEKVAIEEELVRLETKKAEIEEELARLTAEVDGAKKMEPVKQTEVVKTAPIITYVETAEATPNDQIVDAEVKDLELPALGEEKTCEKVEEKRSFFDDWWWAIAIVSFILGGLLLDVKVYKTSRK